MHVVARSLSQLLSFGALLTLGFACSEDLTQGIPDAAPPDAAGDPCGTGLSVFLNRLGGTYFRIQA
jgi:RsiW-degrading membrane proteinase PrsW (M82 family)